MIKNARIQGSWKVVLALKDVCVVTSYWKQVLTCFVSGESGLHTTFTTASTNDIFAFLKRIGSSSCL